MIPGWRRLPQVNWTDVAGIFGVNGRKRSDEGFERGYMSSVVIKKIPHLIRLDSPADITFTE